MFLDNWVFDESIEGAGVLVERVPALAPDMVVMGDEPFNRIAQECEVNKFSLQDFLQPITVVAHEQGLLVDVESINLPQLPKVVCMADLARVECLLQDGFEGCAGRFWNVEEVMRLGWVDRHR